MKRLVLIFAAAMVAICSFSQVSNYTMTYHNMDENDFHRAAQDPNTNTGKYRVWFNEPIELRTYFKMWSPNNYLKIGYLKTNEDSTASIDIATYSITESGGNIDKTTKNAVWLEISNTNTKDEYLLIKNNATPVKFPSITLYDTIYEEVIEYITVFLDTTSIDNSIDNMLSQGIQCYVSDGYLNVEMSFIEEITVYSIEGKKVAYNQNFTSIFVGDLFSGMYIAIIKKEGKEYYHKLSL